MSLTRGNRRTRALLSASAVAVVLGTTLGAAPRPSAPLPEPSASASAPLDWAPCAKAPGVDPRQECATVRVPLDYDEPQGTRIDLAVSRIRSRSPHDRRGALLLIPGGPGGSGLNGPSGDGAHLPDAVRDTYDLIGFDPRGMGRSTPVSCDLPHEDLSLSVARPWPAADGSITANAAYGRRMADACGRDGDPVLRSISTANEARDIDGIRAALGERTISAWGVSYGTYVGAVYAQLFPRRTDRWVLDSNGDPDPRRVERGWLANFATGAEDVFPDFAAWAARPDNPDRLAAEPADVRPLFLDLAARLDRDPLPWPGANPPELNGNVLRQTLLDSLYDPERYPALARLVLAARDGSALPETHTPPDDETRNSLAVIAGTLCNDVAWPRSVAGYARDVAESRVTHPLTAGMPVNVMACAFWPDGPKEPPVRITSRGPSNVLLVQNRRDPATPYRGALEMRRAFGDRARMVTVDSVGHGAYVDNGNACGDRLVTDFLLTGERPARDTFCAAQEG